MRPVLSRDVVGEDLEQICARTGERLRALEGSTLLVTGGAGFLPSYILDLVVHANDRVLSRPCRVICVDNLVTGTGERIAHLQERSEFRFIQHDVTEALALEERVDYIIHAASIASPPAYRKHPLETIEVNVRGTRNLLEVARAHAVRSFVYLSSSEIYGDPAPEAIPTPETYRGNVSCTGPRACYDESKRLAETLCMVYYRQFCVSVKIVRPFNVYGPHLRLDDGRVIPDFLRDALKGRPIALYSDGQATRSFCYVSDAVTAIILILLSEHNGEAFNVGNDEEVTIEFVAREINALFEGGPTIAFAKSDDIHYLSDNPRRRCPDLTKVKRAVPWTPLVSLCAGLKRTVRWYRDRQLVP